MVGPRHLALAAALATLCPVAATATPGIVLTWSATTGTGTAGGSAIDALVGDVLTLDVVVAPDAPGMQQISISLGFDPTILLPLAATECPAPPNLIAGSCNDSVPRFASPFTAGVGNPSPSGSAGDFDGNGAVGSSDVALFMADFGMTVPPGDPIFDLNADLIIGFPDLAAAFPGQFGFPGSPGLTNGAVTIIETSASPAAPLTGSFTLAQIDFEVTGGGIATVGVGFLDRIDGYVDGTLSVVADRNNPAGITVLQASVAVPGPAAHVPAMGAIFAALLAIALLGVARLRR